MGDESLSWARSRGVLNPDTREDCIEVQCQADGVCEILFLPESDELIGLSEADFIEFAAIADELDEAAKQLAEKKSAGDPEGIAQAKEDMVATMKKVQGDSMMPLHDASFTPKLTEVYSMSGRKLAMVPGDLVERYRTARRVYKMRPARAAATAVESGGGEIRRLRRKDVADESLLAPRLIDGKKRIDTRRIKKIIAEAAENPNFTFDWPLVKPKSGQIPTRYLLYPVGGLLPDYITDAMDDLVTRLNENMNVHLQDRDEHKADLIKLLDPDQTPEEAFDEDSFGNFKQEVSYIWDSSSEAAHSSLVEEVNKLIYIDFEDDLEANRRKWLNRIKNTDLPTYVFDISAGAQILRYTCGATASGKFNPKEGVISANVSAELDLCLAEGKVTASMFLPDNEGLDLKLPFNRKGIKWEPLEESVSGPATFDLNKSFVRPHAVRQLVALRQEMATVLARRGRKIQLTGHADAPGAAGNNTALSEERARMVHALLTFRYGVWLEQFVQRRWGTLEIQIMLNALSRYIGTDRLKEDGIYGERTRDAVRRYQTLVNSVESADPLYFGRRDPQGGPASWAGARRMKLPAHGMINTATLDGQRTLRWLIIDYMRIGLQTPGVKANFLRDEDFMDPPWIVAGESQPAVATAGADERNRRVTWTIYRGLDDENNTEAVSADLGDGRVQFDIFASAWAGANAAIAANAQFNMKDGMAELLGTRPPPDPARAAPPPTDRPMDGALPQAGASAAVFAGAKATAGVKGEIQWKCPERSAVNGDTEDGLSPLEQVLENNYVDQFVALGSVGMSVTGSAGAGAEADFKIGFDRITNKFIIKAKAAATVGLGFGGRLEFAIGVKHIYYFLTFAYTQLRRANFSFVDLFEDTDEAFERYCALSYRMLLEGNLKEASLYAWGANAMAVLGLGEDLVLWWKNRSEQLSQADKIIEIAQQKPYLLRYTSPEVKGRMLYVLAQRPQGLVGGSALGRAVDAMGGDLFNEPTENAVLEILKWVQSKRDYREVLEHMEINVANGRRPAERLGDCLSARTLLLSRFGLVAPECRPAQTAVEKLTGLLDGEQARKFVAWEANLPEVAPTDGPVVERDAPF
ncbi:MAG TPA: hypothetical protein ENK05_07710 [Gammaproteobacteria bacterium]|nr:hypothetical protein [Gammaproteobacteria bacterium]